MFLVETDPYTQEELRTEREREITLFLQIVNTWVGLTVCKVPVKFANRFITSMNVTDLGYLPVREVVTASFCLVLCRWRRF